MAALQEVPIRPQSFERLEEIVRADRVAEIRAAIGDALERFAGRTVLNVNSTATGGGVAEMLPNLLSYLRGAGIDARWVVVQGNAPFFAVTKRLHNAIHGAAGDEGALGEEEHAIYDDVLAANARELLTVVNEGDFVLLHDPQTAGLVAPLQKAGAQVVWRSHIGTDHPNEHSIGAWEFLRRYLEGTEAYVFSRSSYTPEWLDRSRLHVIPPSIDPFSCKNADLATEDVRDILAYSGIVDGSASRPPTFQRPDGTTARIDRHPDVLQTGPPPGAEAPLVVQISRWDRLKDMAGVMNAFAKYVAPQSDAHLLLAGPNVSGVTDDPEGAEVLMECMRDWRTLPHGLRKRVHLACLPTADVDENAILVNAIQRHAAIVTQKSLAEGFGLTVSEALWKERPTIASRVGGITDQIEDGVSGLLTDDPTDLEAFGGQIVGLLKDPMACRRLGRAARARVVDRFLSDRHLLQFAGLVSGHQAASIPRFG